MAIGTARQQTNSTNQSNMLWLKQHQTELGDVNFSYISTITQPATWRQVTSSPCLLLQPLPSQEGVGVGLSWGFLLAPGFCYPVPGT